MADSLDRQIAKAEKAKFEAETEFLRIRKQQLEIDLRSAQTKEKEWYASAHQNNIYHFFGSIDRESASSCLETISYWARRNPGCEITIVWNSPGGSVIDGLALYDELVALRDQGHEITTIGRGMCASMGAILLQSGGKRIIGKNAHMLIHQISYGAIGSFGEIEDEVAFAKQLQDRLLDILAERSSLSRQKIKNRWERRDWWLGADEVLKYGFADEIG